MLGYTKTTYRDSADDILNRTIYEYALVLNHGNPGRNEAIRFFDDKTDAISNYLDVKVRHEDDIELFYNGDIVISYRYDQESDSFHEVFYAEI